MIVKTGTKLIVHHKRKGAFHAEAIRNFDTEIEGFYPVKTLDYICGMSSEWEPGDEIPCEKALSVLEIIEDDETH